MENDDDEEVEDENQMGILLNRVLEFYDFDRLD